VEKRLTLYLICADLQPGDNHAGFLAELGDIGAQKAFSGVWIVQGLPAPSTTAKKFRDRLKEHLDEAHDTLLVMGIESAVNIAAFGDVTRLSEVLELPPNH
jgi:hypothetical protein